MLYRDADYIKDVEWVIFDEVHYINDEVIKLYWNYNLITGERYSMGGNNYKVAWICEYSDAISYCS